MFAASKTASVSGAAPDDKFNYVTMLLHGDGTNGAQNNTFLDSSTNNFTITRNGNTTQGSFSPYGSNWSNYFNGSTDYLSLGTSTNLALGAGDFTIEVWLSVTAYNASTSNIFEWRSAGGVPSNIPTLYLSASGVPTFYASVGSGALITGSSAVALNTWTHLAIVRSGSTVTMYLNGTSVGSATNSANLGTQSFYINDPQGTFRHNGYFSNVRMVKGTAVYTGSFTPSTTPLTAITNTQLLTCQSNRFIDNSSNAFAITANGTPSVQRFNPFGTSTAYSTSVIGGSGYFDGTGDYLTAPSNAALSLGTGNYTIETFAFPANSNGSNKTIWTTNWGANGSMMLTYDHPAVGAKKFGVFDHTINAGAPFLTSSSTFDANQFLHIAVVRSGTTTTLYVNGVSQASATQSTNLTRDVFGLGSVYTTSATETWNGYISDARVVKGTAVYTSAFTTPTSPLTAITNTSLLTNFTNGAIFDNAMMNDLETVGNAQISTSVKKYGTGSLYFDGTGDCLKPNPATTDLYAFSSGDFTIEMWFYITAFTNTYSTLYDSRPVSTQGAYPTIAIQNNGKLYYYVSSAERIATATSAISTGQWYHLAVCRSGTSTKMFLDGTQVGSTYTDSTVYVNGASRPVIGAEGFNSPPNDSINGYIDDLRITKGYARYTATFTAPTSALSDTGPY